MNSKICSKCGIEKDLNLFCKRKSSKDGHRNECLECRKVIYQAYMKEYNKKYSIDNRDRLNDSAFTRRSNNPESIRKKECSYSKKRRVENNCYKFMKYFHVKFMASLKTLKSNCMFKFVPFTLDDFLKHLESQFEWWMTWSNYGTYRKSNWNDNDPSTWKWSLDHIIPQSQLKFSSYDDPNFNRCWALENLRPLSAKKNTKKAFHSEHRNAT